MTRQVLNCREAFRLHAMDLPAPGASAAPQPHWMLRDKQLKRWISDLQKEYCELWSAGGDPLEGDPIEPEAVIRRLGFADRGQPHGFVGWLGFTTAMLVATTREAARVHSETIRLRRARQARSQG